MYMTNISVLISTMKKSFALFLSFKGVHQNLTGENIKNISSLYFKYALLFAAQCNYKHYQLSRFPNFISHTLIIAFVVS